MLTKEDIKDIEKRTDELTCYVFSVGQELQLIEAKTRERARQMMLKKYPNRRVNYEGMLLNETEINRKVNKALERQKQRILQAF